MTNEVLVLGKLWSRTGTLAFIQHLIDFELSCFY